ncbi:hypothetical protein CL634_09755 [bacterium]|nr:hypothetical protein [bacterium]
MKKKSEHSPIAEMEVTKPSDPFKATTSGPPPTYDELIACIRRFFDADSSDMTRHYEEGIGKIVEEPTNIVDFMINVNDLTYHYISNKGSDLSSQDKRNFKELHKGIQSITRVISQYDSNLACKEFYAYIIGYVVKTLRNFYYDRSE